jgi:uncharacterized membrane protein
MDEKIAGVVCYAGGWITGLIMFLIDKRPFVRFHAAQSIVVFGLLNLIYIGLASMLFAASFGAGFGLLSIGRLFALALWIVLMVKAYQGQMFRLPVVGQLVDNLVSKAP